MKIIADRLSELRKQLRALEYAQSVMEIQKKEIRKEIASRLQKRAEAKYQKLEKAAFKEMAK